jgi:hypothetical protein
VDIPLFIDACFAQPERTELLQQPRCAPSFSKGWSGNADQRPLPIHEQSIMQMQPAKGLVDSPLRGKLWHLTERIEGQKRLHGENA